MRWIKICEWLHLVLEKDNFYRNNFTKLKGGYLWGEENERKEVEGTECFEQAC